MNPVILMTNKVLDKTLSGRETKVLDYYCRTRGDDKLWKDDIVERALLLPCTTPHEVFLG